MSTRCCEVIGPGISIYYIFFSFIGNYANLSLFPYIPLSASFCLVNQRPSSIDAVLFALMLLLKIV